MASRIGVTVAAVAALLGAAGGVAAYTFMYADGAAYLRDDPTACANCHIMQSHLDAWTKSSHQAVASCNDCHAPHTSTVEKLWVKGVNGFNHSLAFTTGHFPEPLRITEMNRRVTENACRHCHEDIVDAIEPVAVGEPMSCIRCHFDVGHPR